ncbi:DUF1672 family protein [Sporosarcina sp. E16_8]|uniref:DUF1672 family protein n=1 Tax=Sporosarcina sp. E16_8 TaxID=2789295 RepID=UPI001A91C875|nr:DUF1672 family protein [Sporosarcina sp. E16_8]MBO0589196.1 DUF1672 family protein [Sporosarcina sp. E16_8]
MDNSTSKEKVEVKKTSTGNKENAYEIENVVRVQNYTGEGYKLRDSRPETGQLAEENREEIEEAVQQFFLKKYKTEVIVHNMVGAVDGASVFVESVGEPHFYTFAIVGIDVKNETVELDNFWSQEGQVEYAINGGLYAMAFEEEFLVLDEYLERMTKEYPIVGIPIEAIENVKATGFATSYYSITPLGDVFKQLFEVYLKNPDITKQELKSYFIEKNINPERLVIPIEFYMEDENIKPDKEIFDKLVADIEKMKGIPQGAYSIYLNDNLIDKRRGIGMKDNTLERTTPNKIVKD